LENLQKDSKKVSIIIPTRNRSSFLERSVSFAFRQVYHNIEVIVSNNNSSDDTEAILVNIKKDYPKLKVINHKNSLSISNHWDEVIRNHSTGHYILVIPDDDILRYDHYISEVVSLFSTYRSIGLVFSNYVIVDQKFNTLSTIEAGFNKFIKGKDLFNLYNKNIFGIRRLGIPHLTCVFSRNAYVQTSGFDCELLSPDTYLWLKILLVYDAGFISNISAEYLVHNNNLSDVSSIERTISDIYIPRKVYQFAKKNTILTKEIMKTLNRLQCIFYIRIIAKTLRLINFFNFPLYLYLFCKISIKTHFKSIFLITIKYVKKIY
jgi:glycosyltransferase involved in cell wall biosynthesis